MVVVEVRQGTLGGDGRGWGPAGNTGRGWSWLRSDREQCASRVAVEQEEEERRGGEEQATDIKSNNPHLAGGEQKRISPRPKRSVFFCLNLIMKDPELTAGIIMVECSSKAVSGVHMQISAPWYRQKKLTANPRVQPLYCLKSAPWLRQYRTKHLGPRISSFFLPKSRCRFLHPEFGKIYNWTLHLKDIWYMMYIDVEIMGKFGHWIK